MPFDGLALRAVTQEIREKLAGGRVEKVAQPERDEIVLHFRNNYMNYKLLISASPNYARVHLTELNKPNPDRAPMFCMLLRKHLIGGKLLSVEQPGLERVLDLRFGVLDELGQASELTLHAEIMGRHSNAVLTQPDGKIIDSLKRVTEERSRVREVLPGIPYEYPPAQGKLDPLEMDAAGFLRELMSARNKPMDKLLSERFTGLSPATAAELLRACGLDARLSSGEYNEKTLSAAASALTKKFREFNTGRFEPTLLTKEGETPDFMVFSGKETAGRACASVSEAVEACFASRDGKERLKQKSANMTHTLMSALARLKRKLEKQEEDLRGSENMEGYRIKGELLTANLHVVKKGQKTLEAENYYAEAGGKITIELDPALTPSENAQKYFKRYNKAKTAKDKLAEQIAGTREEIDYLEGLLQSIEISGAEKELDEIRAELVSQGYMKESGVKTFKKAAPSLPRHYQTGGGTDIYVGRNNAQNDFLTLRFARADDVWMHAKKIPGSHVIIRAKDGGVPDDALLAGAMLAAYYSKARSSSSVPVDYTQKKNVKKPAGARPGYVIYLTNRTLAVTPDEAFLRSLKELDE